MREHVEEDFRIVFLGDGKSPFSLELTWLKDREKPYDLGEKEYHLAFTTDRYDELHSRHEQMGVICYENLLWGSISLPTRTATGLKSYRKKRKERHLFECERRRYRSLLRWRKKHLYMCS